MPEVTLRTAIDTYADQAHAAVNYGAARRLALATTTAYAYLYFTRPMPLGAVVTSAKLWLWYDSTWTGATTITAQPLAAALSASRLTWNAKPAAKAPASLPAPAPAGPAGTMVEVDVTAIMQTVADGAAWYGLRLATPGTTRWLTSAEGTSARRPQLYVSWSEQPHAPTTLSPDGNDAVSMAAPVLRFQVTDVLGDTTIAAVNVQTDNAPDFVGAWDSGWVATGDPQLDLATLTAPAYPGLAEGQSIYWRVRVKDGAGLVSAWSDDAQLRRVSKGALTIDNPAAGASPYVTEPTPPILWTFAGVQEQWQVTVVLVAEPSKVLANSGVRTGTDTAWTVPAGVITGAGPYRVRVRVWDNVDRDPADAFTVQYRTFVLTHDPATPGVLGLAVSQPNPWPGVLLSWARGTAPDSWVIERDGKVIDSEVLPGDSLVSGTNYEFSDTGARAWTPHTWRVRANVNGKTSDSAEVSLTPTLRGIWLLSKTHGLRVWLAGAEGGSWTEPEDATAIAPLGATRVVRRVQGVRNYEGSLGGQLVDAFGRTAAQYEADLRTLRDNPDDRLTLALADFSLRVLIGNVQFYPTPQHVPPTRMVTFDFWEV